MPYAIMVFVVILGIGGYFLHDAGYDSGYATSDNDWKLKYIKTQLDEARLRSEITEREAAARVKYMRAADEAKLQTEALSGTIVDMHIAGLWIDPNTGYKGCPNGENEDPLIEGSGTDRIRLPEAIEGDILSMTKDAQLVVGQYNELREIMKNLPCVEIVE